MVTVKRLALCWWLHIRLHPTWLCRRRIRRERQPLLRTSSVSSAMKSLVSTVIVDPGGTFWTLWISSSHAAHRSPLTTTTTTISVACHHLLTVPLFQIAWDASHWRLHKTYTSEWVCDWCCSDILFFQYCCLSLSVCLVGLYWHLNTECGSIIFLSISFIKADGGGGGSWETTTLKITLKHKKVLTYCLVPLVFCFVCIFCFYQLILIIASPEICLCICVWYFDCCCYCFVLVSHWYR